ncbi:hypothetical protein MSG37_07800 [Shewanella sp. 1CM18E]|uniref:hypothetical protein n=1 Tax=Shewanella sp. 1CM18E TaxID=2929169 RepID=UPI0020C012B5|nr:hypothetical protein [Shewanella sp. 1CM18E]MCK8044784.1 hypothetical protein [Shewanella sp. 1CM18E]
MANTSALAQVSTRTAQQDEHINPLKDTVSQSGKQTLQSHHTASSRRYKPNKYPTWICDSVHVSFFGVTYNLRQSQFTQIDQ